MARTINYMATAIVYGNSVIKHYQTINKEAALDIAQRDAAQMGTFVQSIHWRTN